MMAYARFPSDTGETVQKIAETIKNCDTSRHLLMIEMDDIAIDEMSTRWRADATAAIGVKLCGTLRQNKGIGKVLLNVSVSSLFHERDCHRIILYMDLTNTRAQHVYEQLSFTKMRVNENSWADQLGRQQSSVDYVLYQKDFISYLNG